MIDIQPFVLFYSTFFVFLFFEKDLIQDGLEVTLELWLTLDSRFSCLCLPGAEVISMYSLYFLQGGATEATMKTRVGHVAQMSNSCSSCLSLFSVGVLRSILPCSMLNSIEF